MSFEESFFKNSLPTKNDFVWHFAEKNIKVYLKREDQIHPVVSGNKYRKLKYNLIHAIENNYTSVMTFGGAYSNHIAATAYACKLVNLPCNGIIRGEELENLAQDNFASNPSLHFAHQCGMKFKFVSRKAYRDKKKLQLEFLTKQPNTYVVPEGGTNQLAVKGCKEMLSEEDNKFNYIAASCGTGGTLAGLIEASENAQKVLGFSALKGDFLQQEIQLLTEKKNWELITDYHFGGYAKVSDELVIWMNNFYRETKIRLDPIYTAKMMFGLEDLIKRDYFSKNTRILAIHTGGLQGVKGMNEVRSAKGLKLID